MEKSRNSSNSTRHRNMLHSKTFVKKTRGGKVNKVSLSFFSLSLSLSLSPFSLNHNCLFVCLAQQVREHYLRDDIYCGAPICKLCDSSAARLSPSASTILVLDTNVVLNQVFYLFSLSLSLSLYLFCSINLSATQRLIAD